jgi:hypothetical protein
VDGKRKASQPLPSDRQMTVSHQLEPIFPPPRHRGYNRGMAIALVVLGVSYAALCIWLTVRIVNRRERWAKWTLAGTVIGVPALYLLSFGPACWISVRFVHPDYFKSVDAAINDFYYPVFLAMDDGPEWLGDVIHWWREFGVPDVPRTPLYYLGRFED